MKFPGLPLLAGLALAVSAGAAHASTYTINVWNGAPNGIASSANAELPTPTGSVLASFTYSGALDFNIFSHLNSDNTMANFFNSAGGSITNFTSSVSAATFGSTIMSVGGDAVVTYIQILGNYYGAPGTIGSISHDDGASVYSNGVADYNSPGLTTELTQSFALSGVGSTPLDITYVEANGDPSNLVFSVPEPASIALLGLGLVGLGAIRRRRGGANVA